MTWLLVAAGGAAGSMLRHGLSLLAVSQFGTGFPWGTLAVNVLGSAGIGIVAGLGLQGEARLLLVTGLLGGFTTFSAFSLETGLLFARLVAGGGLCGGVIDPGAGGLRAGLWPAAPLSRVSRRRDGAGEAACEVRRCTGNLRRHHRQRPMDFLGAGGRSACYSTCNGHARLPE